MANLTLSIDDVLLEEARSYASKLGKTVNGLVREHLADVTARDARLARARARLSDLATRSRAEIGPRDWTREQLYDRGLGRKDG